MNETRAHSRAVVSENIIIVGGGLAGVAAAENYRKAGGSGRVTILSADSDLPVHRPPLSKEYLRGDESVEKVFVHPAGFYQEHDIEVRLQTPVTEIRPDEHEVLLQDGQAVRYETLVLATGARPRSLPVPGGDMPGVHYLRSLRSADALRGAYDGTRRAVIIGAGFIGIEVAATLTQRGVACTVVEMAPRMWSAIVPPVVSDFVRRYFTERGVEFRFGAGVGAIEGDGKAERVRLADGETISADLVVAGVGAALNTGLAERAGLDVDRGVIVDGYFRTSHPDIFAIGDIASFPDPVGGRIHLEHWDNALNQGQALGLTLAGQATAFRHVAYFFSDLFDLSLNMVGYPSGWEDVILRGDPAEDRFTTLYVRDGKVRAALMVNDDEHFDAWTRLIEAEQPVRSSLADRSAAPLEAAR